MKLKLTLFLFIIFLSTECIWGSQQIETVVFPSEDEIAEAFSLGEISFEQFIVLTELIANQVEPNSFLLEEIPYSLLRFDTLPANPTPTSQEEYFLHQKTIKQNSTEVLIKNQFASYIAEDASSRYQSSIYYTGEQFNYNFILKKEFSGRERFTRRYISFTPTDKRLHITVGNFTKRFGLGGVIGYRGKLLSYSDEIDSESFLFPDYGGFNGVYLLNQMKNYEIHGLTSYSRNDEFSFLTSAIFVQPKSLLPSLIVGWHEIKNRNLHTKFNDVKTSLYKKVKYLRGFISAEAIADFNNQNNSTALIVDGKHKTKQFYITYSFWNYGDAFLNISGGSKTSLISERVELENLQYDFLSKRSNQTGGLLKSKLQISNNWQADLALISSFKNSDTTEFQVFSQLSRKIQTSTKLSFDFLYRNKERNEINNYSPEKKYQSRFMLVHQTDNYYFRNYLLVLDKTDEPTYIGIFSEVKLRTTNYGKVHLWINMSRFNRDTNHLDYFYTFIKTKFV